MTEDTFTLATGGAEPEQTGRARIKDAYMFNTDGYRTTSLKSGQNHYVQAIVVNDGAYEDSVTVKWKLSGRTIVYRTMDVAPGDEVTFQERMSYSDASPIVGDGTHEFSATAEDSIGSDDYTWKDVTVGETDSGDGGSDEPNGPTWDTGSVSIVDCSFSPTIIDQGDDVTLDLEVENNNGMSGQVTVRGAVRDYSREVTRDIGANETRTISMTLVGPYPEGDYDVNYQLVSSSG